MDAAPLILQRYDVLYAFWLAGFWDMVPEALMRQRPHPGVNSIAWNLWHVFRVEDMGLNRFVAERPQVLDEDDWPRRLHVPWRHIGGGMSLAEVDDLSQRIDLRALRDYGRAVQAGTRDIMMRLDQVDLTATLDPDHVRAVVIDEGVAHPTALDLVSLYSGWTKGMCLMNFGMTHPYQHVGEMGVIASLLGVDFD
jgi:DinB superfamily